jgi:outer membrane protein
MKVRFFLCALLATTTASAQAPGQQTLTMEQAVEIAMKQQPSLRQQRASVEAAKGRVDSAKVNRKPTVTLSASANAGGGGVNRDLLGTIIRGGANIGASANWRIYDFGLTAANIRAAEANEKVTESSVAITTLDIRQDVEISYLEAVARARLVTVADATVKAEEQHVDQARRFVQAQAKDPIEVVQAQSRFANAKASLAQAQSSAAIALANLRAAVGYVDPSVTLAVPEAWPAAATTTPPGLPQLVATARAKRPEIGQLDLQIAAADASLDAAHATNRPILSASANTGWNPTTGTELPNPSWNVSLSLSWQVFDGGRRAAEVRIAKANRESALAQRDALLLTLTSQLDALRAQITANRAAADASNEAVQSARAQLKLAEARYAQGLGSQIELADAQTAVTTAEGNLIQAEWQLASAWASLRRALGTP